MNSHDLFTLLDDLITLIFLGFVAWIVWGRRK